MNRKEVLKIFRNICVKRNVFMLILVVISFGVWVTSLFSVYVSLNANKYSEIVKMYDNMGYINCYDFETPSNVSMLESSIYYDKKIKELLGGEGHEGDYQVIAKTLNVSTKDGNKIKVMGDFNFKFSEGGGFSDNPNEVIITSKKYDVGEKIEVTYDNVKYELKVVGIINKTIENSMGSSFLAGCNFMPQGRTFEIYINPKHELVQVSDVDMKYDIIFDYDAYSTEEIKAIKENVEIELIEKYFNGFWAKYHKYFWPIGIIITTALYIGCMLAYLCCVRKSIAIEIQQLYVNGMTKSDIVKEIINGLYTIVIPAGIMSIIVFMLKTYTPINYLLLIVPIIVVFVNKNIGKIFVKKYWDELYSSLDVEGAKKALGIPEWTVNMNLGIIHILSKDVQPLKAYQMCDDIVRVCFLQNARDKKLSELDEYQYNRYKVAKMLTLTKEKSIIVSDYWKEANSSELETVKRMVDECKMQLGIDIVIENSLEEEDVCFKI